jgi:hypothetical protein
MLVKLLLRHVAGSWLLALAKNRHGRIIVVDKDITQSRELDLSPINSASCSPSSCQAFEEVPAMAECFWRAVHIDIAVRLLEAALSRQESKRWLFTLLTGFIGAIVGSSVGDIVAFFQK